MLYVLNPTYTLQIVIKDELPAPVNMTMAFVESQQNSLPVLRFYDSLVGKTGCDEVLAAVKDALYKANLKAEVHFTSFEHK